MDFNFKKISMNWLVKARHSEFSWVPWCHFSSLPCNVAMWERRKALGTVQLQIQFHLFLFSFYFYKIVHFTRHAIPYLLHYLVFFSFFQIDPTAVSLSKKYLDTFLLILTSTRFLISLPNLLHYFRRLSISIYLYLK